MSTFDSTKLPLPQVIRDITTGKIQLPDFQRGWIWDDDHIKSLLISVARSFPIGAVMTLDTGGDVGFQVRPIEGVTFDGRTPEPDKLILDGQQRLTSLTSVLAWDRPVTTTDNKRRNYPRYYYIDIKLALEGDRMEDAFISIPQDRKLKTNFDRDVVLDLSNRELECDNFYFPCSQILNSDDWEMDLQKYCPEKVGEYMDFRRDVINEFRSYQLPIITLGRATSKEAVCLVFEKVNTGGVALTVFELVTATFAADGFSLRDDWFGNVDRKLKGRSVRLNAIRALGDIVEPTDFLQAISLRQSYATKLRDLEAGKTGKMVSPVSAKRTAVLSLKLEAYQEYADDVEQGYENAAQFLRKQCIFSNKDVPYRTQIVPLAAVMSILKERWREPKIYDRLTQWYWCGVLGELYGGAVDTRIANDFEDLINWFTSDLETLPRTISDAFFQESRLDSLRSRRSAAYKGLNSLVLQNGAEDFFWKESIRELSDEEIGLDIHHIFPRSWCEQEGVSWEFFESCVNKTPISYKANRMIGGKSPSDYLQAIQRHEHVEMDDSQMARILETHGIDSYAMRIDNFELFYRRRKISLLKIIERVMGKSPQLDQSGVGESDSLSQHP